jgi:hypothetical protein
MPEHEFASKTLRPHESLRGEAAAPKKERHNPPAPGHYDVVDPAVFSPHELALSSSFGGALAKIDRHKTGPGHINSVTPGVGAYDAEASLGTQVNSTKPSNARATIGDGTADARVWEPELKTVMGPDRNNPEPGAYFADSNGLADEAEVQNNITSGPGGKHRAGRPAATNAVRSFMDPKHYGSLAPGPGAYNASTEELLGAAGGLGDRRREAAASKERTPTYRFREADRFARITTPGCPVELFGAAYGLPDSWDNPGVGYAHSTSSIGPTQLSGHSAKPAAPAFTMRPASQVPYNELAPVFEASGHVGPLVHRVPENCRGHPEESLFTGNPGVGEYNVNPTKEGFRHVAHDGRYTGIPAFTMGGEERDGKNLLYDPALPVAGEVVDKIGPQYELPTAISAGCKPQIESTVPTAIAHPFMLEEPARPDRKLARDIAERVPGVGQYDLSRACSAMGEQVLSTYDSKRGLTFGRAKKDDIQKVVQSWGDGPGSNNKSDASLPGVGEYDLVSQDTICGADHSGGLGNAKQCAPVYSFGGKGKVAARDSYIPPSSTEPQCNPQTYPAESTLGEQVRSTQPSAPRAGFEHTSRDQGKRVIQPGYTGDMYLGADSPGPVPTGRVFAKTFGAPRMIGAVADSRKPSAPRATFGTAPRVCLQQGQKRRERREAIRRRRAPGPGSYSCSHLLAYAAGERAPGGGAGGRGGSGRSGASGGSGGSGGSLGGGATGRFGGQARAVMAPMATSFVGSTANSTHKNAPGVKFGTATRVGATESQFNGDRLNRRDATQGRRQLDRETDLILSNTRDMAATGAMLTKATLWEEPPSIPQDLSLRRLDARLGGRVGGRGQAALATPTDTDMHAEIFKASPFARGYD